MEKGQVWLPSSAPWLETVVKELRAFPNGKHDDQVDSISQILYYWPTVIQSTRTRCNPSARRAIPKNYKAMARNTTKIITIANPNMPNFW